MWSTFISVVHSHSVASDFIYKTSTPVTTISNYTHLKLQFVAEKWTKEEMWKLKFSYRLEEHQEEKPSFLGYECPRCRRTFLSQQNIQSSSAILSGPQKENYEWKH